MVLGLLLVYTFAHAEGIMVQRAEAFVTAGGQLSVNTRFQTQLPSGLKEALNQGVVLPFRLEFQLVRPRFKAYYLDVKTWFQAHDQVNYKLSYQVLTNRYRVTIGSLNAYYNSLDEALRALGAIYGWRVLEPKSFDSTNPKDIVAQVRLVLDIGALPKPFQLNALDSSDWTLSSDWATLNMKDVR